MMLLLLFRSRWIDVRSHWGFLKEGEIRGLSSIFGAARKYGSGWIGQVILIGWKCSATLTVKLNYAPNKNSSFFLLQMYCLLIWNFSLYQNVGIKIFFDTKNEPLGKKKGWEALVLISIIFSQPTMGTRTSIV